MKTKIYITVVLAVTYILCLGQTQKSSNYTIDSLQHFNKSYWLSFISQKQPSQADAAEFMKAQERQYIIDTYYPTQKQSPQPPTIQQACTNIDFESGNTNGWTLSNGFHPLFNATGCCPTAGGAQTIMTGNGTDPCGGFPVVSPGGLFSIRLGNNGTGGRADRMEQTFSVTAANLNFTYKYAVVFQDPGHAVADQPAFTIQMLDSSGNAIPCTYYNVSAGQNIPGFINSPNCAGVVYKPWTNVVVDLSSYLNQNVTIRFSTYDCSLGGHYGYAYIDGSCLAFQQVTNDTLCVGSTKQICAPPGFGSYVWSGGTLTGNTNQCVNVSAAGNYSIQTTLVTGCTGPTFYYNVFTNPKPNANFTTQANTCTMTVNFNNTSSISAGSIISNNWDFGDGNTSNVVNPTHTYATPGTYLVRLITGSNNGCFDTTVNLVPVNSPPVANFNQNVICQGSPAMFNDLSVASAGVINNWNWNFGDGSINSFLQNPSHIYTTPGTYSVTLYVSSTNGCVDTAIHFVTVNALPNVNFNVANSCFGTQSIFNNTSSIPSGTITNWMWDINGDGIVDANTQNLTHNYPAANTYTVILNASSNANCINSYSTTVTIHPLPIINFSGNNVCHNAVTNFTNNSSIGNGNQITNYAWTFGNSTSSMQTNPMVIYTNPGTYVVSLTATSNNNCVNTGTSTVNVWPNPNTNFSTPNVCQGATSYFTNNTTISAGTITNWMWDVNGDNNTDSTSQNPTYIYTASGNYVVSLTAISNNNCTKTFTSTVTVNPLPNTSFVVNNGCQGALTTFSNTSTISNGQITSYNWNFGNSNGSAQTNPQLYYYNHGNYVVSLTATSNNNCVRTNTALVSIYANPVMNFTATTACLNQATQFTNLSSIAAGTIAKYRWDFDDNNTWDDSTANPTYVYPTFGYKNCTLQGISNNNCYTQKMGPVLVHGNPVANFKANSTCLGDITNFQNYSTSTDGSITTYLWDFNGDNITDNLSYNPTLTYTANGIYLTKLEVQTQYGCINVMSKPVYVNAKPVAMFTATNKQGCPSLCVPFQNSSYINNGTIVTYQWDFGDNSGPLYIKNPTHCYNSGTFNVSLKCVSDSGCISNYNSPALVNVYPTPVAGFNVTPEEIDEFTPVIDVTNTAQGATSVSYMLNPGPTYNTSNFTHNLIGQPGQQLIVQFATNSYGCTDTIIKILDIKPAFVIYLPNTFTPNADGLNDGFGAKGVGIVTFEMQVYDRWGHKVFETNDIFNYWDGSVNGGSEPIKDDVYTWKVQVKDINHKNHDLVGHVTVIK
ncbi:MAG: PKD domain-containing protein [Bacteroidia bacterium]|nr:PKD domain-containing protein [Bacteroidia bacterium]